MFKHNSWDALSIVYNELHLCCVSLENVQTTCVCVLSRVWLFATPWLMLAHKAPLYTDFSRQEYQRRLPFPSPGDLSNTGTEPMSPASAALAGRFFTTLPPGKPIVLPKRRAHIYWESFKPYCLHREIQDLQSTDGHHWINWSPRQKKRLTFLEEVLPAAKCIYSNYAFWKKLQKNLRDRVGQCGWACVKISMVIWLPKVPFWLYGLYKIYIDIYFFTLYY